MSSWTVWLASSNNRKNFYSTCRDDQHKQSACQVYQPNVWVHRYSFCASISNPRSSKSYQVLIICFVPNIGHGYKWGCWRLIVMSALAYGTNTNRGLGFRLLNFVTCSEKSKATLDIAMQIINLTGILIHLFMYICRINLSI